MENNCEHEPLEIPWGSGDNRFIELFDDRGNKIIEIFLCKKCKAAYWEEKDGE